MKTSSVVLSFSLPLRIMHWLMAVLLLGMLFIGVAMVASLAPWQPALVSVHKSLGALLGCLVLVRIVCRWVAPQPALPQSMPYAQKLVAHASHFLLYALMIALPVVGWAMQSAADDPWRWWGLWQLPNLVEPDAHVYSILRRVHGYLAYTLFATVVLHLAAALFHGLIRRDGVLSSMIHKKH